MEIPKLSLNDILELKKPHPCGDKRVQILRLGSDLKIKCLGCDHVMTIERIKLEKAIRRPLLTECMKGNEQ